MQESNRTNLVVVLTVKNARLDIMELIKVQKVNLNVHLVVWVRLLMLREVMRKLIALIALSVHIHQKKDHLNALHVHLVIFVL